MIPTAIVVYRHWTVSTVHTDDTVDAWRPVYWQEPWLAALWPWPVTRSIQLNGRRLVLPRSIGRVYKHQGCAAGPGLAVTTPVSSASSWSRHYRAPRRAPDAGGTRPSVYLEHGFSFRAHIRLEVYLFAVKKLQTVPKPVCLEVDAALVWLTPATLTPTTDCESLHQHGCCRRAEYNSLQFFDHFCQTSLFFFFHVVSGFDSLEALTLSVSSLLGYQFWCFHNAPNTYTTTSRAYVIFLHAYTLWGTSVYSLVRMTDEQWCKWRSAPREPEGSNTLGLPLSVGSSFSQI